MILALLAIATLASGAPGASIAASAAGSASAETAEELDRMVAVVRSPAMPEPRLVTLSRLREETRIALVSRGAILAATEPLDAAALSAGLEWLIDQILLMDEATRLQVFEVDSGEATAELARFRARFDRPADYADFLARHDLPEEEVQAVLRRMLRVRRYLESRASHAAHVSEADVTAWLDHHATEIGTRDRDVARARLADERVAAEVKALVRDVRARAEVRVLGELRGAPAVPAPRSPSGGVM